MDDVSARVRRNGLDFGFMDDAGAVVFCGILSSGMGPGREDLMDDWQELGTRHIPKVRDAGGGMMVDC